MSTALRRKGSLRRFGLIGYPLGHSLSPLIHERIMGVVGLSGEYKLYELEPEALPVELPRLLATLDGFNCTIPYKEVIMPYMNSLAPSASLYGAINTVHRCTGHNTDGAGFAACSVPLSGRRICVLGAGGVARVLTMEAIRAGAREIVILARNFQRAEKLVGVVKEQGYQNIHAVLDEASAMDVEVLLNGTPVGMWPHVRGTPMADRGLRGAEVVFDTIYNPTATGLVLRAKSKGIWAMGGLQMLFEQALASQRIWNPEINFDEFTSRLCAARQDLALEVLRQNPIKLVLTGFMGSGKTQVGKALANRLAQGPLGSRGAAVPFVDLDDCIAKEAGQSITELFASQGEGIFRQLERQVFLDQLDRPGAMVLATGGGTLVQEGMVEALFRSQALVIYLDAPFELALRRIARDPRRPMLQAGPEKTRTLYELRKPLYEAIADLRIAADGEPSQVVGTIMNAFGWDA